MAVLASIEVEGGRRQIKRLRMARAN